MKTLTLKNKMIANNAWGKACVTYNQKFMITREDVGIQKNHYLGYNHKSYKFSEKDIGKKINQQTDNTNWTCWSFCN